MKIKTCNVNVKPLNCLIIGYDVAKFKHNFHTSFQQDGMGFTIEDEIGSSTHKLRTHFQQIKDVAAEYGFHGVRVACEPTGGYEKNLLRIARSFGFYTEYVNGEATAKSKVIESNDSGKNDIKDARIIFDLASRDKTLSCNSAEGVYGHLKMLNGKYEDVSLDLSRLKNRFSSVVDAFFPDLTLSGRQLHSKLCRAVIEQFKLNPYKIASLDFDKFKTKVENSYSRVIGGKTEELLLKVWTSAQCNSLSVVPEWQIEEFEEAVLEQYKRIVDLEQLKARYKQRMIELFSQTCEYEKLQAQPANDFMLARIVAETGSFGNYAVLEKLLKYAGLNLREHTSGTYKGQVRLSKKGNSLLRKILGQVAFSSFIKSGCIYADYYKKKKEKAGGIYGLTCVIRKVLKMLYGICRSDAAYNKERVQCQNIQPLDNVA